MAAVSSAPLVRLRGIHKRYRQGDQSIEVLKGITLDIAQGEFVALQGASGSGKSTLLHILGLLDRPSSGSYELEGRDVSHLSDDELSALRNRMTGFIFQSFYLIPYATALENVMLPGVYAGTPRAELRRRAGEILDRVGLADRAGFTPAQLSGGQPPRVAIARALVNGPRLLLADEPTGQLDSATSKEIMALISSIHATGMTVILVTHDEATAAYAQRRIHIVDGRAAQDGSDKSTNESGVQGTIAQDSAIGHCRLGQCPQGKGQEGPSQSSPGGRESERGQSPLSATAHRDQPSQNGAPSPGPRSPKGGS